LARLLLQHGADVKPRETTHGADALLIAAARGRTPLVQLLLEKGADARSLDTDGKNGLMWAAVNGHAETVSLLLKAGVDPSAKDGEGKTAAALAREAKRVNIEELLKTRRS
jgi:ankyrin repeat protein